MIAQTSVVVRYIVTAGVLSYAVSFPIYSEKDVRVTFSTDGRTETALVPGADYTVAVLSSGGGTVTLNSAGIVPAGAVLAVASAIPATQEADFSATTDVDTGALETQLDRQVQMIQQLEAELDRAVKVPAASEDTPEEVVQSVYAARDAAADSATDAARNAAEAGQSALAAAHSEQEAAASAADAAASADLAQSLTEVGPATSERLGFVRIGQGISVDETGLISTEPVTLATPDAPGIVQVGAGLEVTLPAEAAEGEEAPTPGILSLGAHASEDPEEYGKGDFQFYGHVKLTDNFEEGTAAKDGVAISAKGVKDAWDRLLNLQSEVVITSSGNWIVPETATYGVTCIAGGGKGGNGSTGVAASWSACRWGSESVERYGSDINHGGNGGGGGGAGQTITQNVTLTKGDIIPVTVGGGDGGSTAFGEYLTALGGGTGGNGVAPTYRGVSPSNCHNGPGSFSGGPGSGGAAGFSYGSPPSGGGVGGGDSGYWGGSSTKFLGYVSGGNGGAGGTSTHGAYGNGGIGGNGAPVNKTSVGSASSGGNGTQGAVIIVINALST